MHYTDTHCHIHESEFYNDLDREAAYKRAVDAGVRMICVGTNEQSSQEAVDFVKTHPASWAVVGVHPHESKTSCVRVEEILKEKHEKVVGIGEIGLDYYYMHSPKEQQIAVLEQQLQWAIDQNLPVSFHVRDAFDDFWPIFNNFPGLRGVLHSFTDNLSNMQRGLENGLYIGVNGISTFTKDENQRKMYESIPIEHMLLETDAPFLTPLPHRGKVNEPAFVSFTAQYHAIQRGVAIEELAETTSHNATTLFSL